MLCDKINCHNLRLLSGFFYFRNKVYVYLLNCKSKWNAANINGILDNEKYTGCARIQKTFTPDFLTKKVVKNTGQVPSYFVEQSHPAILIILVKQSAVVTLCFCISHHFRA
ncbi:recombinase family protein [Schwartzia succinivorans]|uniref:recombinase family protein n=1 Tax=Schwartzia succinivorans TaxID=55507 RepID=UPI002E0D1620